MSRLTKTAQEVRKREAVARNWVVHLEANWMALPPEEAAKLKVGVNFIGRAGQPRQIYVTHLSGFALPVCVTLPEPPDHYIIDEATKLMDERMAQRKEKIELSSQLAAERAELEAVEEIERRFHEQGIGAVTLEEMQRVALHRRGPEYVAEAEQAARERIAGVQEPQQQNPTTEEIQS